MFTRIKRLSISALALTLAATIAVPGATLAVGTLDQKQEQADRHDDIQCRAQTFTAGLTGALDRVSLLLATPTADEPPALTVQIRDVASGSPGSTILSSAVVSATDVGSSPEWVDVDFASPATVTAGTRYAIVLSVGAGSGFWTTGVGIGPIGSEGPYGPGSMFNSADMCATWSLFSNADHTFRTYVTQAEPPPDVQPRGDIGGPCADPAYYGIFDNTASSVALKFRFRWYTRLGRHTVRKTVPAGAIFRTWEKWVKPFTTIRVAYKNPTTGKWVNLAKEESVKGTYPRCEYKRGFTYPDA